VLLALIILFELGYLGSFVLEAFDSLVLLSNMTAFIFFMGAIYVFFTIDLSIHLFKHMLDAARILEDQVLKRTEEFQVTNMELQVSQKKLEEALKFQSQFLANVSHEIRTPMTAILGYLNLLIDNPPGQKKERSYLLSIQQNAKQLLTIMDDLLDLSRIEADKLKLVEEACFPAEAAKNVIALLKPLADKKNLRPQINPISSGCSKSLPISSTTLSNSPVTEIFKSIFHGWPQTQNMVS
jgi:signal transduction histidine kinase